MKSPRTRQQAGYALILMVLALMGLGGVVIADMAKNARKESEDQRFQHNRRVLEEAKQALLMYAYRYPQIALDFNGTVRGPGRLPCSDTDNNGSPNTAGTCYDNVGRFPWNAPGMEFYDARDATGERLWYVVSENYFNGGDDINSDSFGGITIYDQSGTVMYDGAVNGIAAVIIAPGQPIARDDAPIDGVYEYQQVRSDALEQTDPVNYLDTYTLMDAGPPLAVDTHFDNSLFTLGENDSDDDNFILGPVYSQQVNDYVINDQIIVVTAEEVNAMAEKSVLHTYREALREYRATVQAELGVDGFPWLDRYDTDNDLTTYDAVVNPNKPNPAIGRLPSIFADYFDAAIIADSRPIRPELRLSINIDGEVFNLSIPEPAAANTFFRSGSGDLVTQISGPGPYTITRYFWDGYKSGLNGPPDPNSPIDFVWEMCPTIDQTPPIVANEDDCNRTTAGTFEGAATDGISDVWLEVRLVTITFSSITDPIEFALADRTAAAIEYWSGGPENPDPQNHVYIAAEYDDNPSYISNFSWSEDEEFLNGFSEEPFPNSGTPTYDAGDTIKVGLPYYPVLPTWVLEQNNWHNMVQVAYSSAYEPGGDGICTVGDDDCLTLLGSGGLEDDKVGLLVLAGNTGDGDPTDVDLVDVLIDGSFVDDLPTIFEGQNNSPDLIFDKRPANVTDVILVLD